MKTLTDFKTALVPGSIWDTFGATTGLIRRRKVGLRQSNAVAFESDNPNKPNMAWLYWPKAIDLVFLPDIGAVRVRNKIMDSYLVYAPVASMDAACLLLTKNPLANGVVPKAAWL